MACARNTNIQITEEYVNSVLNTKNRTNCRKYKSVYPSFTPTINSLSVSSSVHGTYSNVMINGTNFLPPCYGTTYVQVGNIYNDNFSPAVNQSYPGVPNLSNSQIYTLT